MGKGSSRRPARGIAWMEHMRSIILQHGRLTGQHVEEFILLFVPMPLGGVGPGLQRFHVGAKLRDVPGVRIVEPLTGSSLRPFCRAGFAAPHLALSHDHVDLFDSLTWMNYGSGGAPKRKGAERRPSMRQVRGSLMRPPFF